MKKAFLLLFICLFVVSCKKQETTAKNFLLQDPTLVGTENFKDIVHYLEQHGISAFNAGWDAAIVTFDFEFLDSQENLHRFHLREKISLNESYREVSINVTSFTRKGEVLYQIKEERLDNFRFPRRRNLEKQLNQVAHGFQEFLTEVKNYNKPYKTL